MAILGSNGILRMRREPPAPVALSPSVLHLESNSIALTNQDFWSGDWVYLASSRGLPSGRCPDGQAFYWGSDWLLGQNRAHVTSDDDPFYADDASFFYDNAEPTTAASYYIYRDQLDRVSFYATEAEAMNGDPAHRVPLSRVDWGSMVLAPQGTEEYNNEILRCAGDLGDYRYSDAREEATLDSICNHPPAYLDPMAGADEYDNADVLPRGWVAGKPWLVLCDLQDWQLELSAPSVDVTSVGERWGQAIKSVVTGGGTLNFFVERRYQEGSSDSTALLQLLMLTEKGCKAEVEFWMATDRGNGGSCDGLLPGDLYYSAEVLITQTAVNVRPTQMIAGSASFVTTGEVSLRMGR
jgi:hypothetical protein